VADTVALPDVAAVRVTEQLPLTRVQVVELNEPKLVVQVTVPVGVLVVPAAMSVTVAVHVDPWFATTGDAHVIEVEVVRRLTVIVVVPGSPAEWVESPP